MIWKKKLNFLEILEILGLFFFFFFGKRIYKIAKIHHKNALIMALLFCLFLCVSKPAMVLYWHIYIYILVVYLIISAKDIYLCSFKNVELLIQLFFP
jgi:hypothetical protein